MVYTTDYQSPLGTIFLAADEKGLTGLWLEGQKYYAAQIKKEECRQEKTPVLKDAERWLDIYFQGKEPDFMPALHPVGTEFQSAVWEILRRIPYGRTITYVYDALNRLTTKIIPDGSGLPASAIMRASCSWNFAFSTVCLIPWRLSCADRYSDFSTDTVPTNTGCPVWLQRLISIHGLFLR